LSEDRAHRSEIDRLKELIRQSGFPLQIEIASFLNAARAHMNWADMEVSTGAYYLDKETKKGRELDIKVNIPIRYAEKVKKHIGIFLKLLIQCKRIPGNVWVFFKTSHEIVSVPNCTSLLDSLDWTPRSHVDFAFFPDLHYRHVTKVTLHDEYILDEKKSNKRVDNLFEATITLAKATSYELDNTARGFKSYLDRFEDILKYPDDSAELFYPIVVFDGKMFLAEKTGEYGEMSLDSIDHVCLFFDYVSGNYDIDLSVDVVQKDAFGNFFQSIVNDVENLRKTLETDIGIKFREEVMRALTWYVGTRDQKYK